MEVVKDFDNFYGLARRLQTVLEFGVFLEIWILLNPEQNIALSL